MLRKSESSEIAGSAGEDVADGRVVAEGRVVEETVDAVATEAVVAGASGAATCGSAVVLGV